MISDNGCLRFPIKYISDLYIFGIYNTVIQNILAKYMYLYLIWVCWHCKYIVKLYLRQMFHVDIPNHP